MGVNKACCIKVSVLGESIRIRRKECFLWERFMDAVKDTQRADVRKEDAGTGEMEADDVLWRRQEGAAERRGFPLEKACSDICGPTAWRNFIYSQQVALLWYGGTKARNEANHKDQLLFIREENTKTCV